MASALRPASDASGDPSGDAAIVFVCRNGVAMSVWSALAFNRLAAERGLPLRAVSRVYALELPRAAFQEIIMTHPQVLETLHEHAEERRKGAPSHSRKMPVRTPETGEWKETLVELSGIEPLTSSLRTTRSPN